MEAAGDTFAPLAFGSEMITPALAAVTETEAPKSDSNLVMLFGKCLLSARRNPRLLNLFASGSTAGRVVHWSSDN